jgi:hypothetical protein
VSLIFHSALSVKAGYIIQVMTSAVKDKWGVDSSINLSPIKAPVQYKRKPLKHLLISVLKFIPMWLFNIPGLWLDNAVIFKIWIPWLTYHEIFYSSTNKTDRHNITEILLKVALNTINLHLCVHYSNWACLMFPLKYWILTHLLFVDWFCLLIYLWWFNSF